MAEMDYLSEGSTILERDTVPAQSLQTPTLPRTNHVPKETSTTTGTPSASIPMAIPSTFRSILEKSPPTAFIPTSATRCQPCSCNAELSTAEYDHRPLHLPQFRDPLSCVWTSSHAANAPTEDRSASLVNLLLQPLPPEVDDSETQLPSLQSDYRTLVRLSLWCVVDGHGGGCVATYASEVLLPHIAASVSRVLQCSIVDRGVCMVNGQLRDANALDWDSLITTTTSNPSGNTAYANPNSIQYRSPEEEEDPAAALHQTMGEHKQLKVVASNPSSSGTEKTLTLLSKDRKSTSWTTDDNGDKKSSDDPSPEPNVDASFFSRKTTVKTAASPAIREELLGTHSPGEVAAIRRAITESFLAVDEGWINSIDPIATHQNSCQSNGRWNSGACALVVFTIQRLDWTSVDQPEDPEKELEDAERNRTSQNQDAARRRMLDNATRVKRASSMSTTSSTSSLTMDENVHAAGTESEITETEGEDGPLDSDEFRKRKPDRRSPYGGSWRKFIRSPGGCSCHFYRAHDAYLYTAHVGDCRAVMLGSAPPRTIKVRSQNTADTTDDESSHHSSDETECLSSSDHDADSSEEEDIKSCETGSTSAAGVSATSTASPYKNFPRRVARQRRNNAIPDDLSGPFIALPPLETSTNKDVEIELDTELTLRDRRGKETASDSSTSSQDSEERHLIHLPPVTRPIDLTSDHSAYNPAEVSAVLRRCNNAPRAISAGVGGGIKRVAGSLAVTRALGDAYLKTPELSFAPFKNYAPYITARPEVNCRPLVKEGDKVLILASDGVWGMSKKSIGCAEG